MAEPRLHRTRQGFQTNPAAARTWQRRHNAQYPLRNRWHIIKARARTWLQPRVTWRQIGQDLIYLVRG